jgi:hypothetical protein
LLEAPITLKQLAHGTPVRVKGSEIVEAPPGEGTRELGFRPGSGVIPTAGMRPSLMGTTVCCWDANWGTIFQADDCG